MTHMKEDGGLYCGNGSGYGKKYVGCGNLLKIE